MIDALIEDLAVYIDDPVGFVYWAFPWGQGVLADKAGPETWQLEILQQLKDGLVDLNEAIRLARASGHGIGKSALVAWIILWSMTAPDTRGIVTASTETQLRTRTWPEVSKWHQLFIARDLFRMTATSMFSVDPDHEKTWRFDAVPWSENNPTAFAGMHNKGRRLVIIFDEASEIADVIWETIDGALTDADTQIIWAAFGNPTSNEYRFRQCFPGGKFAHRWHSANIDARTVKIGNHKYYQQLIDDWGIDSDYVRYRVLGQFPKNAMSGFIALAAIEAAMSRELTEPLPSEALVLGVDVARFGDDASVIYFRRGRDARSIPPEVYRGKDTMFLAQRVATLYAEYHPEMIFIDEGGVGAGVVDRCLQLGVPVIGVQFGAKADRIGPDNELERYANKRAEMWGFARYWLKTGCLPENDNLKAELAGPQYAFNARDEIQLEKKSDMKSRGLASPDFADAFALTFAFPVISPYYAHEGGVRHTSDYDPINSEAA